TGLDVRDGSVRVKGDIDGRKAFRTVSDYTGELPLKISVRYFLDGKEVKPGDVVGRSGKIRVRYTVMNVTGTSQEVQYTDGEGDDVTETQNVVTPMVGSLTTVLPSNFADVRSEEANAAGDGKGGTKLSFTMTLFPPIGSETAEFGYEATIKDGVV